MRLLRYSIALGVVLGLVVLTAWLMSWPFDKAVSLAPVIVVGVAAVVGLILLWTRIALTSLQESRHPRRILAYWLLGFVLLAVLTILGVKLPKGG